ncbi:hypothetical protein [Mesorhizobium sp. BR1-1-14]|uniref:hypothetical protein n=1 Tax=Mesorhizobium sp. BR1-1-14 TaxID=2876655 RepID=UPI001CD1535F|nr:hypothetical protein [Mesorhizobium sp. BR1-1-14]MBZ9957754.1 hypothetical protein [Mesorhizobium sp. BR1-1-14]
MTDWRQIQVDVAVYAAIWRNHATGDQNENDILKRILAAGSSPEKLGKKSMKKRKWIDDVLDGVSALDGRGYYPEIYASVKETRLRNGFRIPRTFEAIIRREIENHSSDSEAYLGKKDLFTAPNGLGAGYWAIR